MHRSAWLPEQLVLTDRKSSVAQAVVNITTVTSGASSISASLIRSTDVADFHATMHTFFLCVRDEYRENQVSPSVFISCLARISESRVLIVNLVDLSRLSPERGKTKGCIVGG